MTLAERFSETAKQIQVELKEARERVKILETVEHEFNNTSCDKTEYEAVIPPEDPKHKQGKGIGQGLNQCIAEARNRCNRHYPLFVFVNLGESASVALSALDFGDTVHQMKEDCSPPLRVVWTKTDRGSVWLT